MTMEQFDVLKPGDIVLLNSGGEPMTVDEIGDGLVSTAWMEKESGEIYRDDFKLEMLVVATGVKAQFVLKEKT